MAKKKNPFSGIRWGTLTEWLKRHEKKIEKLTGYKPFTKEGKINTRVVNKLLSNEDLLKRLTNKPTLIKRKLHFYKYLIRKD